MISLRPAILADLDFLEVHGEPPDRKILAGQVLGGRLQIVDFDDRRVGLIKTCVLWERLPFMEVLCIDPAHRGRGFGSRAVRLWENDLARRGFGIATVSTQASGTAQQFWRKIGYSDCGLLMTKDRPAEIFLQRILISNER